jgi:hypothetical protein
MHGKHGPICRLPTKSKLTAESGERFVEAEEARRDQDDTDSK